MTREIYYDNSATTRTREEAAKLVYEMLTDCYGNPSSLHRKGFAAQQRLEQARAQMAQALGCQPGEIYFTAGGTEADNLAILGAARAQQRAGQADCHHRHRARRGAQHRRLPRERGVGDWSA